MAHPIDWANYNDVSRRVVTLNGGLIRELPQNPLNSGLGIILICPDLRDGFFFLTFFQKHQTVASSRKGPLTLQ